MSPDDESQKQAGNIKSNMSINERITMYKFYLGIDVAKLKCDTVIFNSSNFEYSKEFKVTNNVDGIFHLIASLKDVDKSELLVILESTAHYHQLFADMLSNNGYNVNIINPIITSNVHKSNIRKTKNDKIDAKIIAKIGFDEQLCSNYFYNQVTTNLKKLTRSRKRKVSKRSKTKIQFRTELDYLAPDFNSLFSDVFSLTPLYLLDKYLLSELLTMSNSKILKEISKVSKGKHKLVKVEEIKSCIKKNKAQIISSPIQCLELNLLVKELNFYTTQIELYDTKIINESLDCDNLLTVPGIGKLSAAIILGELGDVKNFKSPKQIVAYAGLDSSTYQSGNTSVNGRISKRGSPQLRNALYICAGAAMLHSDEWRDLYDKHKANGKHHYVALNAMARKLLHVIWGIYKTDTPYNSELM